MKPRHITESVSWCGAIDWDRRLFDSLIPLPEGTTYNAYLVKGSEKTALIDSVDPSMTGVLMDSISTEGGIDYVVSNHAEKDHSGSIPAVLEKHPGALVLTTSKGAELLTNSLNISPGRIRAVGDGEEISLGGKSLRFIHAPWVHWPETMFTYLAGDNILFSCDFMGAHIAGNVLFAEDEQYVLRAAKRYYAEIMMPFRTFIEKHLKALEALDIRIIAPSHGPVWRNPATVLDAHREWNTGALANVVVIPFVTMHDSTKIMVDRLASSLTAHGVTVKMFNLAATDIGELAIALVDAATIVIGSPMVMGGAHPLVVYAAYLANALRPRAKFASVIGSYGWGGKMVEQIAGMIPNIKAEILSPVLAKGHPDEEALASIDSLAVTIAQKHAEALS